MTSQSPDDLFSDFPAVSREQWKSKVLEELQGTGYGRLVWKTPDGFSLDPWYNREEHRDFLSVPFTKATNRWRICQQIPVGKEFSTAAANAERALAGGADALEFRLQAGACCKAEHPAQLLAAVDLRDVPVYFSGDIGNPALLLGLLQEMRGFGSNTGALLLDALADPEALPDTDAAGYLLKKDTPREFCLLAVDTGRYHRAGAVASQELALALAGVSELLFRFSCMGIDAAAILPKIEVILDIGSSHFMELSKLRALRMLLPGVAAAYGVARETLQPRIFARSSARNTSLLDPQTNLLRLATEAISAILGGCDTLQLSSFDPGGSLPGDFSERITRNIHLLLREESGLDHVVDPAAGSWYIESMTAALSEEAWKLFRKIESAGGFRKAASEGVIDRLIEPAAAARSESIRTRRKCLIGVNRYAAPLTAETAANLAGLRQENDRRAMESDTAAFERLRLTMLDFTRKNGRTPSVVLWLQGDPARSFRVAAFAEDFFRCGGFPVSESMQLDLHAESCQTLMSRKPQIVVLCWPEKDDLASVREICGELHALDRELLVVMAAKPPDHAEELLQAGLDAFIHAGSDAYGILLSMQTKTGVS
jgi:methylmalonyl-CoA mutase